MADTTEKKSYLIDIKSNYQQYIDDLKKAREELDRLKIAQLKLTDEQKKDADFMEKFNAQYRNAQTEVRNATKILDQATLANKAQKGSYEELYRTWQVAQTQLKLLGGTYTTNAQGVRVLSERYIEQKQVVENAKRSLDAFGKGIADNRLNVGNYSEAIQGAIGDLQKLPGPLGMAAGGIQRLTAAFKLFLANPIMLALTAIVGAIGLLVKAFKNSQPLMDAFHKVSAAIGATFKVLLDRVSNFAEFLGSIFNKELRESRKEAKALNDELIGIEDTMSRKEKREIRRANKKGLFEEIREEAKGAYELTAAYQALEDAEIAFTQKKADLTRQIQEKRNAVQDETLTDKERLDSINEAIAMQEELTAKEVEFAKERARISNERTIQGNSTREELRKNEELQAAANEAEATGLKAQKRMLSERLTLINKLSSAEKQALKEREDSQKAANEKYIADEKKRIEDKLKLMMLEAQGNAEKEKEVLKSKYETELMLEKLTYTEKLILKKEYENAVAKIDEEVAVKKKEKLAEIAEMEKRDTEAGYEYERRMAGENVTELENILDREYETMKASVEYERMTANEKKLIDKEYTDNKRELSLIRMAQLTEEMNLVGDIMGSVSGLLGKQTIAAKALSVSQALISTYTAGVKAMAELPLGSGPVLRFLTLASVIAAGLLQVKNILAVKVPGGEGGGSSVSMPTAITSSVPAQRAYAPAAGATFLNQPQLSQAQLNAVPNQNLLTADQIANALSKMPPPIVTVEDINAKVAAGKKIEVRATI